MVNLDEIDYKILDIIQTNGRIKRNEIADIVGLTLPAVSDRLKKLEDETYILGYFAKLNHKLLGKDVTAFITATVDSSKHFAAFLEHVQKNDEIIECHAITGTGTHLLKVRVDNTSDLEKLLAKIQSWQGVIQTRTSVVLSTQKETSRISIKAKK